MAGDTTEKAASCEQQIIHPEKWIIRHGKGLTAAGQALHFAGGTIDLEGGQSFPAFAEAVCDVRLWDGDVCANVTFTDVSSPSTCQFIIRQNLQTGALLTSGFGAGPSAFSVRFWDGAAWKPPLKEVGSWATTESNRQYELRVSLVGSTLRLFVDNIAIFDAQIPSAPSAQIGIWLQGRGAISVTDVTVKRTPPTAFVVMKYGHPFDELHETVIEPVCLAEGFRAFRADDEFGPGLIIADIIKRIATASLVIAEITPENANVFFELGFAFGLGKPVILLAERGLKLPFDISGFRTLFYDNSIGGKPRVEADLRRHLVAIKSAGLPPMGG